MTYKFIKIIVFLGWLASTGCSSDLESGEQKSDSIEGVKSKLEEMLPDSIKLLSVSETDIDGYFEVNFEGIEPLYVSDDGEYLINGIFYKGSDIKPIRMKKMFIDFLLFSAHMRKCCSKMNISLAFFSTFSENHPRNFRPT